MLCRQFCSRVSRHVFAHFLHELTQGRTPNPDILCNREIKFKAFLEKAIQIGGDYLATGHYCRTDLHPTHIGLLKGADPGKDQSYFLYAVGQDALKRVLFPVGGMLKAELRQIARSNSLATANKKDSTGICFIGKRNFKEFLSSHASSLRGYLRHRMARCWASMREWAIIQSDNARGWALEGAATPGLWWAKI